MDNIYASNNIEEILEFLKKNDLLNKNMQCDKCKVGMIWKKRLGVDKYTWRCPRCHTFKSIRSGSFFELNRIPFDKILKLFFHFASNFCQSESAKILNMARSTIVHFYQRLR